MPFEILETTVADVHQALRAGELSCAELVQRYLDRIESVDRSGPLLNSIITLNDNALADARALDQAFAKKDDLSGPLHGIPVLVKDQVETAGIMTTFGSIAMDGYLPARDAHVITRLRQAGAVILGKTAMPDFATSWFGVSSKAGISRNPYALDHDPGGSSGGTGAAIAANLATIGVGEDTCGSIRLPASFNNLVGLKVTPGLISRSGLSPLVAFQDSAGPMCRTVRDVAALLNVLAGYDADDPLTATALIAGRPDYVAGLRTEALEGRTVGVLRQAFGADDNHAASAVNALMETALDCMRSAGARTVDIVVPDLDHYIEYTSLYITHSRHDIDRFLAARPNAPARSVREIHAAGAYHRQLDLFEQIVEGPEDPWSEPDYYARYTARERFQQEVINAMGRASADLLVFPTTRVPAPSRADLDAGKWTTFTFPTNTLIGAQTWMPSISVPAGFTPAGLPVGIEILGLPYGEAPLLSWAYAYEQHSKHRRAPAACA